MLGIHFLRELVQMQINPTFLKGLQRVHEQRHDMLILWNLILHVFQQHFRIDLLPVALLDRLHDGGDQGEESVEYDERRQGREVPFVSALDIVPDHVAGAEQEMGERPFRVVIQERNAVERSPVEIAGALPGLLLLRHVPGEIPQLLPDGEGAAA